MCAVPSYQRLDSVFVLKIFQKSRKFKLNSRSNFTRRPEKIFILVLDNVENHSESSNPQLLVRFRTRSIMGIHL